MIIIFLAGFYLIFIMSIFRTYNFWATISFKLVPFVLGIYMIIYGGMRIDFIVNLFTT